MRRSRWLIFVVILAFMAGLIAVGVAIQLSASPGTRVVASLVAAILAIITVYIGLGFR